MKQRSKRVAGVAVWALALLSACTGGTHGPKNGVDPNAIYYEYQVMGQEGEDSVACRLQCRRGGPAGPTVLLGADTSVQLDDTKLTADSAGFTGYYYEGVFPAAGFAGPHAWQVGDLKTPFTFVSFGLAEVPAQLHRGDLKFQVTGLKNGTSLRVLMVDTAWASDDLNIVLPVREGVLTVPARRLEQIVSGPVNFELSYDETSAPGSGQAGIRRVMYGLRRSFDLVD